MGKREKLLAAGLDLPPGYSLRIEGSQHLAVLDPEGVMLRSASGLPIKVSQSPSDWRSRRNERSRIARALKERTT